MTKLLVMLYVLLLLMDVILIVDLRCLVYSFLLSKRNLKGAKKIHKEQSKKDKFTLAYIENHAIYPKQFHFFQKCWIWYISLVIPKYLAIVVVTVISTLVAIISIGTICALEILFYTIIVRSQFVSNSTTRFDKRY